MDRRQFLKRASGLLVPLAMPALIGRANASFFAPGAGLGNVHDPAGAAWTPASLPNLLAWYTAGVGTYKDAGVTPCANTDTVQQQNDRSGNNYHLKQAVALVRPQYLTAGFNSLPTIKFTAGSTGMLTDANSVLAGTGANSSGFFVGQMLTGTSDYGRALAYATSSAGGGNDYSAEGCIWGTRNTTNNEITSYRSGNVGVQTASLATNYRFGVVFDGTNGISYLNNANAQTTANTSVFATSGAISLGVAIINPQVLDLTHGWDGPISEAVITLGALSSGDRTSLDNYFKSTWGL